MSRIKRLSLIAVAMTAALAAAGCNEDDNNSNPLAPASQARVMAVHASPDAGAVDLLVDNVVAGTGLAFPNNTGYLNVDAGARNIKVNASGTATTVINETPSVTGGVSYSVFAIDSLSSIEALVLVDDLATPASGKAHVRFVHLSPNAPAVDVALQGGMVLFANKSFRESTAFTPFDAGMYDLEVRQAGMMAPVLTLPTITLEAGKIYTVFARGFLNGMGTQALNAEIIANN